MQTPLYRQREYCSITTDSYQHHYHHNYYSHIPSSLPSPSSSLSSNASYCIHPDPPWPHHDPLSSTHHQWMGKSAFEPTTAAMLNDDVKLESPRYPQMGLSSHTSAKFVYDSSAFSKFTIKSEPGVDSARFSDVKISAYDKDLDKNSPSLNASAVNSDAAQVDIYRDLILRHLIQDISGTCTKLNLPQNPMLWSGGDCVKWIEEMCRQFQLQPPPGLHAPATAAHQRFRHGGGATLLAMSVDEFCVLFGGMEGGDTLHAQLQLWKTALETSDSQSCSPIDEIWSSSCLTTLSTHNHIWNEPIYSNQPVDDDDENDYEEEAEEDDNWANSSSRVNGFFQAACQPHKQPQPQHQLLQPDDSQANAFNPSFSSRYVTNNFDNRAHNVSNSTSNTCPSQFYPPHYRHHQLHHRRILPSPSDSDTSSSNASSCFSGSVFDGRGAENQFALVGGEEMAANNEPSFFVHNNGTVSPTSSGCNNDSYMVVHSAANPPQLEYHQQQGGRETPPSFGSLESESSAGKNSSLSIFRSNYQKTLPSFGTTISSSGSNSGTIHLWHFIRELLDQPLQYDSCVRWVNREEGTFKIESSHHLARLWGLRKNRSQMNYDKLSRSLRQYYKKGIIQKPQKKQRLVYKFLPPYNL